MVLALLENEDRRLLARQAAMYSEEAPLWRRYEQACDFLEDDLESGYVRVLQEMIAAGWSTPEIADKVRAMQQGWYDLLTDVATEAARRFGGLGPFAPAEVATLIGVRVHRRRGVAAARLRPSPVADPGASASCRPADPSRRGGDAVRARQPDDVRPRRARRRRGPLGALRRRRADDPAAADVVDHPVAALEARRSRTSPASTASSRSTGAAAGRSDRPVGADALQPRRVRRRRHRRARRHGHRAGGARRRCRAARCGASRSPPTIPTVCSASSRSARRCR